MAQHFSVLMLLLLMIISPMVSLSILSAHSIHQFAPLMAGVFMGLLLGVGVFMVEDLKVRRKIHTLIPFSAVPNCFGIWRYQFLFGLNLITYVLVYLLFLVEELIIQTLPLNEMLVVSLLPISLLVSLGILKEYRQLFSQYTVKANNNYQ